MAATGSRALIPQRQRTELAKLVGDPQFRRQAAPPVAVCQPPDPPSYWGAGGSDLMPRRLPLCNKRGTDPQDVSGSPLLGGYAGPRVTSQVQKSVLPAEELQYICDE